MAQSGQQAMTELLFNPKGRIARNRFWQGLIVVTVVAVIKRGVEIKLAGAMGGLLGLITMMITLGLVYANICIFAKRFHDAGTTGWWIVAVWVGKRFVFMMLFGLFGGLFLGSEGSALIEAMMESWANANEAQLADASQRLMDMLFPLVVISYVVNAGLAALIVGGLPTEPRDNSHGPVPESAA